MNPKRNANIEDAKRKVARAKYNLRRAEEELRHFEEEVRITEEQRETRVRLEWLVGQIEQMDVDEICKIIEERKGHA